MLSQQEVRGNHMGVDSIMSSLIERISHSVLEDKAFVLKGGIQHGRDDAEGSELPVPTVTDTLQAISATRISQAELLCKMRLARKMLTAVTIVDMQAREIRITAGLPWRDAYASTANVYAFSGLLVQTNVRAFLARRRMYEARCASLIRQNYRMHRARDRIKLQKIARCDTWLLRRKSVKGKGSTAEWNDRHNRVKQVMSNAIDLFDRLHSDAVEPTANGGADGARPSRATGMQGRGSGGESGDGWDEKPSSRGRNRSARVGFVDTGASEPDEQETSGGPEVSNEAGSGGEAGGLGSGERRNSIMYGNDESSDPSDYTEDDEFER